MAKRLFVGNLPFSATEEEIRELFEGVGPVTDLVLIADRETGRPRGFGFVEMEDDVAEKAVETLDGQDFGGRPLRVNEAHERRNGDR